MTAVTGKDPGELYADLTAKYGNPIYQRIDAEATKDQKSKLAKLSPAQVSAKTLAGEPITAILTEAPGNHAPIGGLKVTTAEGWFAARPSGTEDVYKIYAESFKGPDHLKQIQSEAQALVTLAISLNEAYKSGCPPSWPPLGWVFTLLPDLGAPSSMRSGRVGYRLQQQTTSFAP